MKLVYRVIAEQWSMKSPESKVMEERREPESLRTTEKEENIQIAINTENTHMDVVHPYTLFVIPQ